MYCVSYWRLYDQHISIPEILSQKVDNDYLIDKLKLGIQKSFNVEFEEKQLTPQVKNEAKKITDKYQIIRRKQS